MGTGEVELLVTPGVALPIELMWEQPLVVRVLNRLSTFARHIWLDPAGAGASSREGPFGYGPTVEANTAVLGAAGASRAALVAFSYSAPRAVMYTASHP